MGLLSRWRRREEPAAPTYAVDDPALVVLVRAVDPAASDVAVVREAAERGVDLDRPLLVRHHLIGIEARRHDELVAQLAEGYEVAAAPDGLWVGRTEVPDGLALARERSRMAGLAQRLGGDVRGWEVLGPGE